MQYPTLPGPGQSWANVVMVALLDVSNDPYHRCHETSWVLRIDDEGDQLGCRSPFLAITRCKVRLYLHMSGMHGS